MSEEAEEGVKKDEDSGVRMRGRSSGRRYPDGGWGGCPTLEA